MAKREIIKIDEEKCNGCGLCVPNCPEGALQIIDEKARLVSDLFCDGLGACIGHCPEGAITIEKREAVPYDEKKVMENIIKHGTNTIKAHLEHLKEHGATAYLKEAMDVLKEKDIEVPMACASASHSHSGGCPGSKLASFDSAASGSKEESSKERMRSELRQWPIQIMLVPAFAPYLNNADILIAADCVAFSYAEFHRDLLKGKILLVGCPKFDDVNYYTEKITEIIKTNNIKSITCAHMEVPCCFGLVGTIQSAIAASGKKVPYSDITITIQGEMKR